VGRDLALHSGLPVTLAYAPTLSIIIPALEVDRELRRCVDSIRILCSDPSRCEIVLVVPSRCIEEAQSGFPEEKVVGECFPNIYGAMNDGVSRSCGRYLYFLGKDDVVLPLLVDAIEVLSNQSPDVVFCDVYWGERGIYSGKPSKLKIIGKNLCHQGIIYSRQTILKYGPYNRRMKVQADQLVNTKILWDRKSVKNFVYLDKPLAWYSGTGYSSSVRDRLFCRLHPLVLEKYVGAWAACLLRLYRRLKS